MPIGQLDPALMVKLQQLVAQRERDKLQPTQPSYPMSALSKATGIGPAPTTPTLPGKSQAASDQTLDALMNMGMSGGAGVTNFASKAERELASKAALTRLYNWLVDAGYHPPDAARAVNQVGEYPRVAAHIQQVTGIAPNANYTGELSHHSLDPASSISRISLKPYHPESLHTTPQELTNTLFHELTHQAQKLGSGGNANLDADYWGGYGKYYEHTARRAAGDRAPAMDSYLNPPPNDPSQASVNLNLFDQLFKRK